MRHRMPCFAKLFPQFIHRELNPCSGAEIYTIQTVAGKLSQGLLYEFFLFARAILFTQFISICRWFQLIYKDQRAPLENAMFSSLWARKRYRVASRFHQY